MTTRPKPPADWRSAHGWNVYWRLDADRWMRAKKRFQRGEWEEFLVRAQVEAAGQEELRRTGRRIVEFIHGSG